MKKSRRRKKHLLSVALAFWATLIGVLILGVATILVGKIIMDNKADRETAVVKSAEKDGTSERPSRLNIEKIPENTAGDSGQTAVGTAAVGEQPSGKYADILSDSEYMKNNNIYAKETANEGEVTLAFAGDILFDPGYSVMASLLLRPNGIYDSMSQDLLDEMNGVDIMMLNNEFPYSNRGTPTANKQFTFRAKPESVDILGQMGVDIVSLANNHAYDYGETALLDTFETLEQAGMPYVGAGRNLKDAVRPVYFIAGDLKIAYVSATQIERQDNPDTKEATDVSPGVFRCLNPARLLEVVKEAEANSDFVIVYIHWGTENTVEPDWLQLDQAPKIVEAGADLIIGDHPHCLQPIQYVDGVPVVYSLGNFWFNSKPIDTGLVKVVLTENGLQSLQFVPALQQDCVTNMLHGEEKERVLEFMRSISPGVNIDGDGYITE